MGDMADRDGRHGEVMFDVFEPTAYCPGGIWGSYHLGTVHVRADIFGLHLTGSVSPTHLLQVSWGTCLYLTMKRCQQSPKFRPRANYFQTPDLLNFAQAGSFSSGHVPAISKKKLQMRFFCTLLYLWRPIEQMINIAQYTRVAQSGKMEESEVFMFFLTGKLFFNQSPFTEQDHSTKSNVSWDWQFWSIC